MTDWQVGDLCICVDFSPNAAGDKPPLNEDKIYPVDDVAHPGDVRNASQTDHLCLKVQGKWYFAARFRKVEHDGAKEGRAMRFQRRSGVLRTEPEVVSALRAPAAIAKVP